MGRDDRGDGGPSRCGGLAIPVMPEDRWGPTEGSRRGADHPDRHRADGVPAGQDSRA